MRIDIKEVISKKVSVPVGVVANLFIPLIRLLIKEKQLNQILVHCDGVRGVQFIKKALDFIGVNRKSQGIENIDSSKNYIFASNHPLGGLDGLVIVEELSVFSAVPKVVVNDILMAIKPLEECFIPINKYGKQSSKSANMINSSIECGDNLIFFPAGLCSRSIKGKITDLKWKKSFVVKSIEYNKDVVPVYVENVNSKSFYLTALLREKLGIKFVFEMMLLPRQLFIKKNKNILIRFGRPISCDYLKSLDSVDSRVEYVRKMCYELKG